MENRKFALEQAVKLFTPSMSNDITFVLDAANKMVLFLSNDGEKADNSQEPAKLSLNNRIQKKAEATSVR